MISTKVAILILITNVLLLCSSSYQAVENMRQGMDPTKAASLALMRIIKYHKDFEGAVVAVNTEGEYGKRVHLICFPLHLQVVRHIPAHSS